jgi:hypothetical protein
MTSTRAQRPSPEPFLELRDRAAIAVMLYNWLRVEALCSMRLGDFVDNPAGARCGPFPWSGWSVKFPQPGPTAAVGKEDSITLARMTYRLGSRTRTAPTALA